MGLLDDAIRQHLELKRQHGAQEEELLRQETEALGPARRDFSADAAQAEESAAAEAADAGTAVQEPVAEPAGWLDDGPGEAPFEPPAPPPPPEPVEPAPEPVPEAPEPAPAAEAEAPAPRRESDTPTQGFDALSRDDEPPSEGDEDVLEAARLRGYLTDERVPSSG